MKLELKNLRNALLQFPQEEPGITTVNLINEKTLSKVKSEEVTKGEGSESNKGINNKN